MKKIVFIGSTGVGKSSVANTLSGSDVFRVGN
jgi:putative ribosome biogenesis GTPase RsgA